MVGVAVAILATEDADDDNDAARVAVLTALDALDEIAEATEVAVGEAGMLVGVRVGGTGVAVGLGLQDDMALPPASARAYSIDRRINSRRESIIVPPLGLILEIRDWKNLQSLISNFCANDREHT
jgi:hypothetical protein